MSIWVDEQFINRVGFRLERFERIRANLYICRCPICGDSKKRADIRRGYFINRMSSWRYYCHNCYANLTVYRFLKAIDPILCDEYSLEIYKEKRLFDSFLSPKKVVEELNVDTIPTARLPKIKETPSGLVCYRDLDPNHPAVRYIEERMIPEAMYGRLFFAPKYRKWNSPLIKQKYYPDKPDHPRLVLPYYWFDGSIYRYTSRAFGSESPRYQQTVIDETKPRVYGLDRVDDSKLVYVLEGQLDSLFLPNCLAVGTANYGVDILNTFPDKIFVPDNQPRNPDVVAQVKKLVDSGHRVCLMKQDLGKDINKMVMDHHFNQDDLVDLIDRNTFQGIEARLQFGRWKKI